MPHLVLVWLDKAQGGLLGAVVCRARSWAQDHTESQDILRWKGPTKEHPAQPFSAWPTQRSQPRCGQHSSQQQS